MKRCIPAEVACPDESTPVLQEKSQQPRDPGHACHPTFRSSCCNVSNASRDEELSRVTHYSLPPLHQTIQPQQHPQGAHYTSRTSPGKDTMNQALGLVRHHFAGRSHVPCGPIITTTTKIFIPNTCSCTHASAQCPMALCWHHAR